MGKGFPVITIITSIVLAVTIFFYIFTLGSYLKPTVYVLQDRISVYRLFYQYIFGDYTDHLIILAGTILWLVLCVKPKRVNFTAAAVYGFLSLIAVVSGSRLFLDFFALISMPLILLLFVCNKVTLKIKINTLANSLVTNYLSVIGIVTGSISLFIAVLITFAISLGMFRFMNYAYILFILFCSLSPFLLVLLLFSLPIKLLTKRLVNKISTLEIQLPPYRIRTRTKILYLSFFVALSIILGFIPHQSSLNPDNHLIGADTDDYIRWVDKLEKSGSTDILLKQAFLSIGGGDRPLTLFFLWLTAKILPFEHSFTIDRQSLVLSPLLVLVVFFLARELTSNDIVSLLAAFLTVVSFQTLVGIYSGYYANWVALIVGYLSFVFAFKYLKKPSKSNLVVYSILIVAILFSHVYTWTVLVAVTILFLLVVLKLNYYRRKSALFLLLIIFGSIVVDVSRMALTGSSAGIEQDINVAKTQKAGLGQFSQRWYNVINTIHFHFGSIFSNFFFFALGLYWLFRSNTYELHNIFILIFFSIGIIPLFIGDWVVQSRVLYDIPFQIPAAMALTIFLTTKKTGALMVVAICIWLVAFSIRALSNF
jgi:hypothetical protein